jgi:lysyl-tRNA synthetase class 2
LEVSDTTAPGESWRPGATLHALRLRARLLAGIRGFFAERGVLEVETPGLARAAAGDVHIHSLRTALGSTPGTMTGATLYLQSSPEFAMKRLLAAGSGPIYQVCRAFRDGERGRLHNPEFTLLEWYRPGWDHHRLMDEVQALVETVLGPGLDNRKCRYRDVFQEHAGLDPFAASDEALARRSTELGLAPHGIAPGERDRQLEFLFGHAVQPALGEGCVYVHDYPASQAALARIRRSEPAVAERFELFVNGVELANGYHELCDADEQRGRFQADARERRRLGLHEPPQDESLLAALAHGLPDCAGVALGLDRLFMIAAGADSIDAVMAFSVERA